MDIEGKVAIVTGGTKGMGYSICEALLEHGASLLITYGSDDERAEEVREEFSKYPDRVAILKADIANELCRDNLLEACLNSFDRVDILVNNAGIAAKESFLKLTSDGYDRVMDVNLKGPLFLAQQVAQQMITQGEGGVIINMASVCGHRAMGGIAYDAAKAGLIRATQGMATQLGEYGIRVNSISPGTHKTEMNRHHWESDSEIHQNMTQATALKRAGEAKEIAGTVIYLASDASSYTTGVDIIVDGGYLATCPGR